MIFNIFKKKTDTSLYPLLNKKLHRHGYDFRPVVVEPVCLDGLFEAIFHHGDPYRKDFLKLLSLIHSEKGTLKYCWHTKGWRPSNENTKVIKVNTNK